MNLNYQVFVVPGSHFDLGWCATIGECLSWGDEIIKDAIDAILDRFPQYKFTIEYTLFLKHFLETYPEYKETVKRLLLERRIQVCSTMVGAMEQILDGEVLIREIVNAKRWIRKELGIDVKTVQHSDLPGHTIQLPQILQKSGIENISYSRFHPPIPLHWWEAPDGSKVLACNHIHGYGWGFILLDEKNGKEKLVTEIEELASIWPSRNILMVQENDLLLPEPEIVEKVSKFNKELRDIKLRISILDEFFKEVREEGVNLPVYKGEFPYGFYSLPATQPVTYREARIAENKLATAEKFSSLREILNLGAYPRERLERAWENLFYCHDHNVSGRRGELNNEVRTQRAICARTEGEEILREVMLSVGVNINYSQKGAPIVVFNPLSWERSDIVCSYIKLPGEDIKGVMIRDNEGNEIPAQVLSIEQAKKERIDFSDTNLTRVDFLFLAKDIPSIGYKVFYVYPIKEEYKTKSNIKIETISVESPFYRIEVTEKNKVKLWWKTRERELSHELGDIIVVEDLRWDLEDALEEQARKEVVPRIVKEELEYEPGEYYTRGRNNFTGAKWTLSRDSIGVIESGPLRTIVRIKGKVLNSPVEEDIILYQYIPRVDFKVTIDWEGKRNTQVRVRFPFDIPNGKITYETPFYGVEFDKDEMPNTYRGSGGRFVQKWLDISNEDFGITLGTQNCAHLLNDTTIEAIILRSTYSCGDPFVWSLNKGLHTFNFSILAHNRDWRESHSWKIGWEFNNPLEIFNPNVIEPIKSLKSILPEDLTLCKVDNPSIVITTIKKSYENDFWVLRCFDAEGRGGEANMIFPFKLIEAWNSNMLEEPTEKLQVEDKGVRIVFKPGEIKNILLKFVKGGDVK
ncbi:MAG: glycosyl hydrolase-related protein [archaeon YNP-WB-040]|jgi:alpha-mannosidase|nr:glycosyl hydrolase-related protein [Candidatus Culexarchaeum yellowstonense]